MLNESLSLSDLGYPVHGSCTKVREEFSARCIPLRVSRLASRRGPYTRSLAMEWKTIRAHYEREFTAAKRRGLTQAKVAKAGGLKGQNDISRLLANDTLGPQVETFVRAVEGLGLSLSAFFAQIERSQISTAKVQNPSLKQAPHQRTIEIPEPEAQQHGGGPLSPAAEDTWTQVGRAIGRGLVREVRRAQSREQTADPRPRTRGRGPRPGKHR